VKCFIGEAAEKTPIRGEKSMIKAAASHNAALHIIEVMWSSI
jgi:hypothetical protein